MALRSDEIRDWKFKFMDVAREVCPAWKVTNDNRMAVAEIFNWLMMLPGRLDPMKGLWLYGDIGTGKSTMLEIVRRFGAMVRPYEDGKHPYGFRITSCIGIATAFNNDGYDGIETYCSARRQAFDDLGVEPPRVQYYGTTVNVMEHVLMARYDYRHREHDFTHVTSNLSISEIGEFYGDRLMDRCKEMFNFVEMAGRTMRQSAAS